MKNFFVIARESSLKYNNFVNTITDIITKHGGTVTTIVNACDEKDPQNIEVPKDAECILTVGGDGTLIRIAAILGNVDLPFAGVNCGHLGYLCDMDANNLEECILNLLDDNYQIESRMMLEGHVSNQQTFTSLNDIVIRSAGTSVIRVTVYINGSYLYAYTCDGLIFSTPTGSTAYNMSANGPIVNPMTSCILLTPINPHTLNSRSIVLDPSDCIEVELNERYPGVEETAQVSFDGYEKQILGTNERVSIGRSKNTTSMIKFNNASFLERIRSRMQEM